MTFQFTNTLQKIFVHMLINMLLDDEDFAELAKKFNFIDKDQDGIIGLDELYDAYRNSLTPLEHNTVEEIVNKLDFANKQQLNFTEFL